MLFPFSSGLLIDIDQSYVYIKKCILSKEIIKVNYVERLYNILHLYIKDTKGFGIDINYMDSNINFYTKNIELILL